MTRARVAAGQRMCHGRASLPSAGLTAAMNANSRANEAAEQSTWAIAKTGLCEGLCRRLPRVLLNGRRSGR